MKKIFILLTCVFFFNFYCKSQFVDLGDDGSGGFREFLMTQYPACFNAAGQLDTTCTAITTEDSLTYVCHSSYIYLTAIRYFDALQYFDLSYYMPNYPVTVVAGAAIVLPTTLLTLNLRRVESSWVGSLPISPYTLPAGLQSLTYTYTYYDFSSVPWPAALKYLNIDYGGCTSNLGVLPSTLETLSCRHQQSDPSSAPPTGWGAIYGYETLHTLQALPAGLTHLDCAFNGFSSLPSLPGGLAWLDCSCSFTRWGIDPGDTPTPLMQSLPTLPAGLIYLKCDGNRLTSLPTLPSSLVYLDCSSNRFYNIWYQTMTTFIVWDYPGIFGLPALPATLQYLNCGGNALSDLPALPPVLSDLNIDASDVLLGGSINTQPNHITTLPALPQTLTYLNCKQNPVTCIPQLPASMGVQSAFNSEPYNLILNYTNVNCIPNTVPGMRIAGSWPLCNVANNTNACAISPIIAGNVFYDNNSNGIQDAGELPRANIQVDYSTGLQTFSDINGHYEGTANIGSNTVSIVPPVYYNAVPATLTHTVSAPNTLVTDLIALQPNTLIDSLKITMTGVSTIRPGNEFDYYIKYENVGTTILNPDIVINYAASASIIYQAAVGAVLIPSGNSLSLGLNQLQPGQRGEFRIRFFANFSAQMNDYIGAIATISGGTSTCSDSTATIVVNSFDPNEKQATTSLTTQQVASGGYINYTILFQNTGTASALHVFLTDTLSALLQANTLQVIEASHACRITQAGNKLLFEFVNINLPDSNHNEPESHGYVRFRVKPVTTLTVGSIVPNQASIYFDFNEAVQTNIATTTIEGIVVVDTIRLISFDVQKHDATVEIYWTTEYEINSKEFIVERSLDGNTWNGIATVNAAGNSSAETNYSTNDLTPAKGMNYYRLKQIELSNNFKYSEVKAVYFDSDVVVTNMNAGLGPNPARDKVTVYLPGNTAIVSINIFNMKGQLVKKLTSDKDITPINISDLSRGVYVVKIKGGNVNMVRKLIVD